jgi:hypothetical protein
MTSINLPSPGSAQTGWNRSFSPGVARAGIAVIVAAVAVLGLLSATFGSNSDSSHPAELSSVLSVR